MPNFQAISIDRHAGKRWLPYPNHAFAADQAIAPLVVSELPKAAMSLPIGFIKQDEGFTPVAVLGLQMGKNLFVAPDGRWVGRYTPAVFRSHPFRLLQYGDTGPLVLCIDEESGRVTDDTAGERFFTDEGKPTEKMQAIVELLEQIEKGRRHTLAICALLQKHQLIQPWDITLRSGSGDQKIDGLFKIDETGLRNLSAEALHEIAHIDGLFVSYCQLLSMQHLPMLGNLAVLHAQVATGAQPSGFSPSGETLDFSGLR